MDAVTKTLKAIDRARAGMKAFMASFEYSVLFALINANVKQKEP